MYTLKDNIYINYIGGGKVLYLIFIIYLFAQLFIQTTINCGLYVWLKEKNWFMFILWFFGDICTVRFYFVIFLEKFFITLKSRRNYKIRNLYIKFFRETFNLIQLKKGIIYYRIRYIKKDVRCGWCGWWLILIFT